MKNNYYKLISVNVCDAKVELEWFYFDGTTWAGVSMIEQSIPVPAWANGNDIADVIRNVAIADNKMSSIRGFELNNKDWARLAQCGRI